MPHNDSQSSNLISSAAARIRRKDWIPWSSQGMTRGAYRAMTKVYAVMNIISSGVIIQLDWIIQRKGKILFLDCPIPSTYNSGLQASEGMTMPSYWGQAQHKIGVKSLHST